MKAGTRSTSEGRGPRLRSTLLLSPVLALGGGLLLGLRRVIAAGDSAQVGLDLVLGTLLVLVLVLVVGAIHVFKDWDIHWRTILATMYLTSAVGMVVYAVIDADTLRWLVSGIGDVALADTRRRIVIGGLDGFVYGSAIGLIIPLLDPRATRFTRPGILRYIAIYALHAGGIALITAIELSGSVLSRFTVFMFAGLILTLKAVIHWWDNRHPEQQPTTDERAMV